MDRFDYFLRDGRTCGTPCNLDSTYLFSNVRLEQDTSSSHGKEAIWTIAQATKLIPELEETGFDFRITTYQKIYHHQTAAKVEQHLMKSLTLYLSPQKKEELVRKSDLRPHKFNSEHYSEITDEYVRLMILQDKSAGPYFRYTIEENNRLAPIVKFNVEKLPHAASWKKADAERRILELLQEHSSSQDEARQLIPLHEYRNGLSISLYKFHRGKKEENPMDDLVFFSTKAGRGEEQWLGDDPSLSERKLNRQQMQRHAFVFFEPPLNVPGDGSPVTAVHDADTMQAVYNLVGVATSIW